MRTFVKWMTMESGFLNIGFLNGVNLWCHAIRPMCDFAERQFAERIVAKQGY